MGAYDMYPDWGENPWDEALDQEGAPEVLQNIYEATTSHATTPTTAHHRVEALCGARTGYTVPNTSSVNCSSCKAILERNDA